MARGKLRIYLGAAPGVGKTYAMLQEGVRRAERGTDVVVGIVETHGRVHTAAQMEGLDVIPRRAVDYRGTTLYDMDLDAVLARRPDVVLVDELAHTNAPGLHHHKRWEDVEVLLDEGIDVISTVNIQHLESMNDVVRQITGVEQQEVIPDAIVRSADQVHLVDQTPEALRRRLAHGNVYPAERVDAALDNYFRVGNLSALRELAMMWVADRVDEGLQKYREEHGIHGTWETRERVVVAITGAQGNQHLVRRASRIASRSRGELLGLHVRAADGLRVAGGGEGLAENRDLLIDLGGDYHEVGASDVADALVKFARSQNATQIVLGASNRSRWNELTQGSVVNDVVRRSGDIDVHVISPSESGEPNDVRLEAGVTRPAVRRSPFSRRRLLIGWLWALAGPALLTLVLTQFRDGVGLPTDLLAFTLVVTITAVIGGFPPAAVAAVSSFLFANWFFTPPVHTWTIGEAENVLALLVFLANAGVIGFFVSSAARRMAAATRARGDAETLAAMAGAAVSDDDLLPTLVDQLRRALGATGVAVMHRADGRGWITDAASGEQLPTDPAAADLVVELEGGSRLAAVGADVHAVDARVLDAFASHFAAAVERRRLRRTADRAERLAEVNELRAGLLAAVSHDLRTPLTSIKAAASTLEQPEVAASEELHHEFLGTIIENTDRLTNLITNLLEMSRIQANAVNLALRPVALDAVVPAAIVGLDLRGVELRLDLDETLPPVLADRVLLERAIANVIDNAIKWSPPDQPVRIDAAPFGDRMALRIVDRGPGIPRDRRTEVLQPFQRIGDTGVVEGTGLGLAVADGFLQQMDGELVIDETPGGGTTMIITLPIAEVTP